jgi:hypothetical protein
LYDELKDHIIIDKFEYLNSTSPSERTLYFNITFAKGTGDRRIEIPSTPD